MTTSSSEGIHGSPSVDVSLDLANRAVRTAEGHHVVITNRPWDAVSGPEEGPHGHRGSTKAALIHVRCDLTAQTRETECATQTHSAVAKAVAHAGLPVGILRSPHRLLGHHDDGRPLRLHLQAVSHRMG